MVENKRAHALIRVDERIERINQALAEASAPADISNKALRPLQLCRERIEKTNSIPQIFSEQSEAGDHEENANELLNDFIEQQRKQVENEQRQRALEYERQQAEAEKAGKTVPQSVPKPVIPAPVAKRTVTIDPKNVMKHSILGDFIESTAEVDDYLYALREQLIAAVKSGDRVRIK